jgi:hypothetical protein
MPTPQFNVRVPEQYHALLRTIVESLRVNPYGADALADALLSVCRQPAVNNVAHNLPSDASTANNLPSDANTEALHTVLARIAAQEERIAALEEREPRMTMLEALEARVAKLEKAPKPPRPATKRTPSILPEHIAEAALLWRDEGQSYRQIRDSHGWPYNFNALGKKAKQYLTKLEEQAGGEPQ